MQIYVYTFLRDHTQVYLFLSHLQLKSHKEIFSYVRSHYNISLNGKKTKFASLASYGIVSTNYRWEIRKWSDGPEFFFPSFVKTPAFWPMNSDFKVTVHRPKRWCFSKWRTRVVMPIIDTFKGHTRICYIFLGKVPWYHNPQDARIRWNHEEQWTELVQYYLTCIKLYLNSLKLKLLMYYKGWCDKFNICQYRVWVDYSVIQTKLFN